MKITKARLKEIIKEEVESNKALIGAIEMLSDKIETLDVSIDFLAAAFIGGDPLSIGAAQKSLGRAYRPVMNKPEKMDEGTGDRPSWEDDASHPDYVEPKEVCPEIQKMIEERHDALGGGSLSEEEALEVQNQIDVLEEIATMRGCE
jgi:hypothetical protein